MARCILDRKSKENTLINLTLKVIQEVVKSGIKKVYLVGSLASCESTVLNKNTWVSDVDMIIDVELSTFLKLLILGSRKNLSERLSLVLKSHVSVTITSLKLARYFKSIRPNALYLFEMTPLSLDKTEAKIQPGRPNEFPGLSDSLNLAFSAIADYLFLQSEVHKEVSDEEKTYILAKRCLTLLNSFLMFKRIYSRSYLERMKMATEHYAKLSSILTENDIKVLQILTDFKLSGDHIILNKLPLSHGQNMPEFLSDYFKKLAVRIFPYLLAEYTESNPLSKTQKELVFCNLLDGYKSHASISFISCFFYAISQVLLFLKDRKNEKLKVALYSVSIERLKAGDFIRLMIGKAFFKSFFKNESVGKEHISAIKLLWDQFMN